MDEKELQKLLHLCTLANERINQENSLWSSRTAAFLLASSFLFAGFCLLYINDNGLLGIIVSLVGLFIAFLQNRWARAAYISSVLWSDFRRKIEETADLKIDGKTVDDYTYKPYHERIGNSTFRPYIIHGYWLPGTIGILWIAALIFASLSL